MVKEKAHSPAAEVAAETDSETKRHEGNVRGRFVRYVSGRPRLFASIAISVAILLAYENIVFRGQSLVASANYHPFDNRTDHLKPVISGSSAFINWYDLGGVWWIWEPAARFFALAYQKGTVPLWDPTVGAGADVHVDVTQGQYFPPYALLLAAGDTPLGRDLYYLALLAMSGIACSLLALRNGLHPIAAAAMGVGYALSGAMTQMINSVVGQSFAFIPVVCLAADWLLRRPTGFRAAAFSSIIGLSVTTSFLPVVISGFLLLPLMAATYLLSARVLLRHRVRTAGLFAFAIIIGIGATAFILVPLQVASRASTDFQAWYTGLGLQHSSAQTLLTLSSPRITYDMSQIFDPQQQLFPTDRGGFFYIGLSPLLLLLLVWRGENRRSRQFFVFLLLTSVVLMLKLLGLPPPQWLGYLPVLKDIHFVPYSEAALTFGVVGLAAFGVDSVIRQPGGRIRYESAVVAAGFFFIGLIAFAALTPMNVRGQWQMNLLELARLLFIAFALLSVIKARSTNRLSGPVAGMLLLAIISYDLISLAHHTRYRRADVWSDVPAYVRYLQGDRGLFRVHGFALTPNVNQGLGLSGIGSRHIFTPVRYAALARRYFDVFPLPYPLIHSLLPKPRSVLNLLNVKYLIAVTPDEEGVLESSGFIRVFVDGTFQIFQNPDAWPRAYLATRYEVAANAAAALEATGHLTRPDTVILEKKPGRVASSEGAAFGALRVNLYDYDRVELTARSTRPAILVMTDNFAPGWTATVNERPAELYVANYAFRGVEVPAGLSRIAFRYRTPSLGTGIWISLASVVAMLALAAVVRGEGWSNDTDSLKAIDDQRFVA